MKKKFIAAIIIRGKKILLIKRSFTDSSEPGKWCPINESLEENELPQEAVVRGVEEEIGLKFTIIKRLPNFYHNGNTTIVFLGNAKGEIKPNPKEVAKCSWFTYKNAMRLEFAYDYKKIIQYLLEQKIVK